FFFQAEDGIRDRNVTGVQTCALPISEQDDGDGDAAQDAVSELDERVVVLRRERVTALTAGPVAAAETGVGQPDRGARQHNQPERIGRASCRERGEMAEGEGTVRRREM